MDKIEGTDILSDMFAEPEENYFDNDDYKVNEYIIGDIKLKVKAKVINYGISRVVWNGSLDMARYIHSNSITFAGSKHILELGAGTGLGGLFA